MNFRELARRRLLIRPGACVVLVAGSRNYKRFDRIEAAVRDLAARENVVVLSGGARGVDRTAEQTAWRYRLQTRVLEPDWEGLGRMAGPVRNQKMAYLADEALIFWDGESRGTSNMIQHLRRVERPFQVFDADGLPWQKALP